MEENTDVVVVVVVLLLLGTKWSAKRKGGC